MFDIGFWELAIIGVIALLVLGPERLPRVARTAGMYLSKARRTWSSVRREIQRELATEDLKRNLEEPIKAAQGLKDELSQAVAGNSSTNTRNTGSSTDKPPDYTGPVEPDRAPEQSPETPAAPMTKESSPSTTPEPSDSAGSAPQSSTSGET